MQQVAGLLHPPWTLTKSWHLLPICWEELVDVAHRLNPVSSGCTPFVALVLVQNLVGDKEWWSVAENTSGLLQYRLWAALA